MGDLDPLSVVRHALCGSLVPATTAVVCGLGPVCKDIYTQHESVGRSSLMKRTLLLAQYLLSISR